MPFKSNNLRKIRKEHQEDQYQIIILIVLNNLIRWIMKIRSEASKITKRILIELWRN